MFRGVCKSIEILKGYMARESLGTPGLAAGLCFFQFACIVLFLAFVRCQQPPISNTVLQNSTTWDIGLFIAQQ